MSEAEIRDELDMLSAMLASILTPALAAEALRSIAAELDDLPVVNGTN